jgi:hypothetical protein
MGTAWVWRGIIAVGCAAMLVSATPGAALAAAQRALPAMMVTFQIKDYAAWRPVFDAAAPERVKAGVIGAKVYRNADAPGDLLVVFELGSEAQGRAWMRSAEVRAAWQQGGVVGQPSFRFIR